MKYNFDRAYKLLSELEGFDKGVHFNPTETTMTAYGIYRKYHSDWKGWGYIDKGEEPPENIIKYYYKWQFWDKVKADDLPSGLDLSVFDFAVNSDPSDASKALQEAVGAYADGIIGSKTIQKVDNFILENLHLGVSYLVAEVNSKRLEHMMQCTLDDRTTYGKGWSRRVCKVMQESLDIASPF